METGKGEIGILEIPCYAWGAWVPEYGSPVVPLEFLVAYWLQPDLTSTSL
jgi:hypothetical protein